MPLRSSCSAAVTSCAAATSSSAIASACSIGASTRVAAELVGGLLGEVDDVVERDGERVDVGGVEVRAAALLGEPAQDRVGDPVALLLAEVDLADLLGGVGDGRERVAQQRGAALGVGAGALEQLEQLGVGCGSAAHPLAP